MFRIRKNYSPALQSLAATISYGNVLWFSDPVPNSFYLWVAFWCLLAVSGLLGLIGLTSEPRCKAAIDRLEERWNQRSRRDRSGNA